MVITTIEECREDTERERKHASNLEPKLADMIFDHAISGGSDGYPIRFSCSNAMLAFVDEECDLNEMGKDIVEWWETQF